MKAKINEGCIGCGMCASICPNVFRMNDEGLAEVYADVEAFDEELVEQAIASCPVSVIEKED